MLLLLRTHDVTVPAPFTPGSLTLTVHTDGAFVLTPWTPI